MAKKKRGYVELFWTCPNCRNENKGSVRVCPSCGSPQPDGIDFHQAVRQELVTDEGKIAQAKAGADIHCAYCGARNPAGAALCSQCKADLSEGARRKAGQVVGAFKSGPAGQIACPNCGRPNPDTALKCANCGGSLAQQGQEKNAAAAAAASIKKSSGKAPVAAIAFLVIACGLVGVFLFLGGKTETISGVVTAARWERSISIEGYGPVESQDWYAEIPADAEVGSCTQELYSVESEPVFGAEEVCGTPYTVDEGSGFGEVVQDCEYHVYEEYCSYTVMAWGLVDSATLEGSGSNPAWPQPVLGADQRLGDERQESFACVFEASGESYTYTTDDVSLFRQCQIGSTWQLEVNTFGGVVEINK